MSILAIAGASGVGKSTFERTFLKLVPGSTLLTSTTTRKPRESDIHVGSAHEYEYLSVPKFRTLEKEGIFPQTFKHYDTLYAHRSSLIRQALESPSVYLGALFVPGIEMLFDIARDDYQMVDHIRAIYLVLTDEEERIRRLKMRGETDSQRFEEEQKQWDRLVKEASDHVPFFKIEASGSPESLVHQAINMLRLNVKA